MAAVETPGVLGTFHGSEEFPIDWQEGERELFWIYDDLHCPNPVSPLFFDIGGWWLTCDHMFRRFGTPFASDWIAKRINGYVYTAAIPADPSLRAEATEYQGRYAPRVPRDGEYAGAIGAYLGFVLPHYAENFLEWWQGRLRPEIERNFAYLDGQDWDGASFAALAVLLEDAIDVHDRHWKIHWMLNFAQFSATMALNAAVAEARGQAEPELLGRLQSSVEDRNWDSIEDLWKMKEELKADDELRAAFDGADTAAGVLKALEGTERGRRFVAERLRPHQQSFGYKAIWSHEFAFKTWVEDPAPIIEAVRGYLATDYDYPSNIKSVHDDLEKAKAEVMDGVEGEQREQLQAALDRSLGDEPADARPPLLHRPGHERPPATRGDRDRSQARGRGRARLTRRTSCSCTTTRCASCSPTRRPSAMSRSSSPTGATTTRTHAEHRPPSWVGTATEDALAFPYASLWGFPEKFHAGEPSTDRRGQGSRGVARRRGGDRPLRHVARPVRRGRRGRHPRVPHDQSGLGRPVHQDPRAGDRGRRNDVAPRRRRARVRDPGRRGHHERRGPHQDRGPDPGQRHDRDRGVAGVSTPAIEWLAPSSLEDALTLRAEHGDEATVVAGGTFLGILMNQGFLTPSAMLSLGAVAELRGIEVTEDGELRLGATVTHREVERDVRIREGWPVLAHTFGVVASPRVRNQATVGGVLADADYASDPPAVLAGAAAPRRCCARRAASASSPSRSSSSATTRRASPPTSCSSRSASRPGPERAVYRKFRSRSSEDRPCVAVAATHDAGELRVVVGAVAETPQHFPDICALADGRAVDTPLATEVGRRYAERVEPIDDARGSAAYRRRVTAVEVRRAIEALAA